MDPFLRIKKGKENKLWSDCTRLSKGLLITRHLNKFESIINSVNIGKLYYNKMFSKIYMSVQNLKLFGHCKKTIKFVAQFPLMTILQQNPKKLINFILFLNNLI